MERFYRRGTIRGTTEFIDAAAKRLRESMTSSETTLWNALRRRQLDGVKFRRQYPFGDYILDFCAPAIKLVIEVDGALHRHSQDADRKRSEELELYGYRVIRFSNDAIHNDLPRVIQQIQQAIHRPRPRPLPTR